MPFGKAWGSSVALLIANGRGGAKPVDHPGRLPLSGHWRHCVRSFCDRTIVGKSVFFWAHQAVGPCAENAGHWMVPRVVDGRSPPTGASPVRPQSKSTSLVFCAVISFLALFADLKTEISDLRRRAEK